MISVFIKFTLAVICLILKRKNIKISYDKANFHVDTLSIFKRKVCVHAQFEKIKIQCLKLASKEVELEHIDLSIEYNTKMVAISIAFPYCLKIKMNIRKEKHLKEIYFNIKNFSLDTFRQIFCNNTLSEYMKTAKSDILIDIEVRYINDKNKRFPRIQYITHSVNDFVIVPHYLQINKKYIVDHLKRRNHLGNLYTTIDKMPPKVWQTIICSEDPMFLIHDGFCDVTLAMAIRGAINSHHFSIGGSSITQQLIKNALLSTERTLYRKMEELILSILAENYYKLSKKDILETYINMVEMAPNIYGIEDGAKFYFEKNCCNLNTVEMLILTYAIPRPFSFFEALKKKSPILYKNIYLHICKNRPTLKNKGLWGEEEESYVKMRKITFSPRFGTIEF